MIAQVMGCDMRQVWNVYMCANIHVLVWEKRLVATKQFKLNCNFITIFSVTEGVRLADKLIWLARVATGTVLPVITRHETVLTNRGETSMGLWGGSTIIRDISRETPSQISTHHVHKCVSYFC